MSEHQFESHPYALGGERFSNGGSKSDNPYPTDSVDFERWALGFHSAAAESFNDHSCGANSEWFGAEKFCSVCGKKTDELE